jgi:hypothetical protein
MVFSAILAEYQYDYFLNYNAYRNIRQTAEELKGEITTAVECISEETLAAITENFN